MIACDDLIAEHSELSQLAEQLVAKVTALDAPDAAFASLRWRLNHVLMVHLAKEDRHLYPLLELSDDARVRRIARRFVDEMGGLAAAYLAYTQNWTAARVAADWPRFAAETVSIMRRLGQRIVREERDLYPMLAQEPAAPVSAPASAPVSAAIPA